MERLNDALEKMDQDMGWKCWGYLQKPPKGKTEMMKTMNWGRADYSLFCDLQRTTWLKQEAFPGEYWKNGAVV